MAYYILFDSKELIGGDDNQLMMEENFNINKDILIKKISKERPDNYKFSKKYNNKIIQGYLKLDDDNYYLATFNFIPDNTTIADLKNTRRWIFTYIGTTLDPNIKQLNEIEFDNNMFETQLITTNLVNLVPASIVNLNVKNKVGNLFQSAVNKLENKVNVGNMINNAVNKLENKINVGNMINKLENKLNNKLNVGNVVNNAVNKLNNKLNVGNVLNKIKAVNKINLGNAINKAVNKSDNKMNLGSALKQVISKKSMLNLPSSKK
jgi:hypothetical protein